jgi:ubiquinone/menaquinone biosynthesis C-methylase UbiE
LENVCRRAASIGFWNGYSKWYKLWMEHNNYHDNVIDVLTTMVQPRWKVLDIGAGSGVLSLPLRAIECEVTALEPSIAMRSLLFEEAFKRGIDWIDIDESRWEDVPFCATWNYDLIIACNTLHLTQIGFAKSLEKIFRAQPKHVFLITELGLPEIKVKWQYEDYKLAFSKCYEAESSFAYHCMDELIEHWSFKKGRMLYPDEIAAIKAGLTYGDGHLLIKDTAHVGMYWWTKNY